MLSWSPNRISLCFLERNSLSHSTPYYYKSSKVPTSTSPNTLHFLYDFYFTDKKTSQELDAALKGWILKAGISTYLNKEMKPSTWRSYRIPPTFSPSWHWVPGLTPFASFFFVFMLQFVQSLVLANPSTKFASYHTVGPRSFLASCPNGWRAPTRLQPF